MAVAVVSAAIAQKAPGVPQACACAVCRHLGQRTARELLRARWDAVADADQDFEAALAARWHRYAPRLQEAVAALPPKLGHEVIAIRPRDTDAMRAARAFAAGIGEFADRDVTALVLAGPCGVGKSFAMAWLLAHELADVDARTPEFLTAAEFGDLCVPAFGETGKARARKARRLARLRSRAVVAIDDLGTERDHERIRHAFDELVDSAYQRGAMLLLTTNVTGADFAARYGERVLDRLREVGVWAACTGPSLRSPSAAREVWR